MVQISDKSLDEFIEISEKEGHTYKTREDARQSAYNLVRFVDVLIEIDQKEKALKRRLEDEPKGFSMEGNGRSCSLCGYSQYEASGWYDKWGFKCMNCQKAVDKKLVPGSLCRDYKNEKYVTDSTLSWKADIHIQTLRKLARQGKLKARLIPNGPYLFLRKDNLNIMDVIEEEKTMKTKKS